jgi:hypothetical protein
MPHSTYIIHGECQRWTRAGWHFERHDAERQAAAYRRLGWYVVVMVAGAKDGLQMSDCQVESRMAAGQRVASR